MADTAFHADPHPEHDGIGVPDVPIDFSVPYRPRERGANRHFGFFPFFAKKPWQVVQEYIKHYTVPGDLVCDPFVGSGVTAVEALVLGRRAVAGDINPVARFITRMTAVAPVDLVALQAAYEQVRASAQADIEALDELPEAALFERLGVLAYPRDPIPGGVRRGGVETVDRLHTPRQLAGLTLLRDAINQTEDALARDLLRVALANTVRYANTMYILPFDNKGRRRSPYRGDVGFLRRFSYSPASNDRFYEIHVWPTFERTFNAVQRAKEETNRLIGTRYSAGSFTLAGVAASKIHEITGEGTVDYCFTDPPYSNEIRFLDLSTLWAAWLGMRITGEDRQAELLIDPKQGKPRERFEQDFAASMESIARALKDDRWFTLVYKDSDLSLWQTIVAACEASGLRFVNAIWQDVGIPSTRQIESPGVNPKGDMYLNFRKMAPRRFEALYRPLQPLALPTRTNYIEHEVERLIVAYLGADIELITSGVIQQVLNSRAFRDHDEQPADVRADLQQVLNGPRFAVWQPQTGKTVWLMASQTTLDPSLEAVDRARYAAFELLRERDEATEGEVAQHLLSRLATDPNGDSVRTDIPALLRSVAQPAGPHRWRFDPQRVVAYKQLRLFFRPSQVDTLRERLESRHPQGEHPLRPDLEGFALLRDRLREANRENHEFDTQYGQLLTVLQTILLRLTNDFDEQIERVLTHGEWAREGIDLRNLPYDDVVLDIVLRADERPFALYVRLAEGVFTDLHDETILVQFHLETLPEWQHALTVARARGRKETLGIPLLSRA